MASPQTAFLWARKIKTFGTEFTQRVLFRSKSKDLLALNLDFDAERRANVAPLDYGPSHPDVAGKIGSLQRVVQGAAARVSDERMIGARETVVGTELVQVGDVFEFAGTERSLAGEGPVACQKSRRAGRKPHNRCRNVLSGEAISDEKVDGGPGLCEIRNIGEDRGRARGVCKQCRRCRGL